jgi:hypothetical protein
MCVLKSANLAIAGMIALFAVSLLFAVSSEAKIDPKTCVGMWLFDEDEGDIAEDSSEKGNDGTIQNADRVDGKFGKALEFDGAASSVEITLDVIDLNKDQTFSVWFKTEIDQDYHARVLHAPFLGDYRLWLFIFRSGHGKKGQLGFGYRAGDIPLEMGSGMPVNDGIWHHAVAVFDHSTKQASLYIDGAHSAQKSIAGIDFNDSQGKLCLGSACPGDFLPGEIDEVAIFNVALEEKDIQAIMNEGLAGALGITAVYPTAKLTTTWAGIKAWD